MKTIRRSPRNPRASFTLVELLVVIGIIAVLASSILFAAGTVLKAAKRTRAAQTATSIQTAAVAYYTEYSLYPVPVSPPTTTDYVITDASGYAARWGALIEALCGDVSPNTGLAVVPTAGTDINTRKIAFLNLKTTDVDTNDAPLNPLPPPGTGNPYMNIALDSDYDGLLGSTAPSSSYMPNFATGTSTTLTLTGGTSTAGVAVWVNCTGKAASATPVNSFYWPHTY